MKPSAKTVMVMVWVFCALLITIGSLLPVGPTEKYHIDKLFHGAAYAFLAFLAFIFTNNPKIIISFLVFIVLMGGGIEIMQSFIPHRSGTIGDFAADMLGVIIGSLLAWQFRRK